MAEEYVDPILKKYADTIEGATSIFKRIYFGDPIRIGMSELPALIIAKLSTTAANMTNTEDVHQVRISLTVVTDVRETVSDDKTMVRGVNMLYNIIEGRQAGTYALKTDSLLYILRHNVELDSGQNLRTDLSTVTRVDYGMTIDKRATNAWAIEGTVDFIANFSQVR